MRSLAAALLIALTACTAAPKPEAAQVQMNRATTTPELADLARRAAGGEDVAKALRAAGPAGLGALLVAFDAEPAGPRRDALRGIVDRVAAQRDATASRLYWFTDLEAAKSAARASGRPILSLRLLGRLDEELSCANSRFFRTALYPDQKVNAILRERFVLHWSSERPAPVATIDFGDGRKIVRTVTGNSLHYVLDAEGRPVDAIPGLYAPSAFARALEQGAKLAIVTARLDDDARAKEIGQRHTLALDELRSRWQAEESVPPPIPKAPPNGANPPSAAMAMPLAISKSAIETMLVHALLPREQNVPDPDEAHWVELTTRHVGEAHLDAASLAQIRAKNPMDWRSGKPAPLDDTGFAVLVAEFERTMEEDTLKNEFLFHATIRRWLASDPNMTFAALNTKVYAELFLTPKSDPWLGLAPPAAFTGIENDGLIR